MNHNRLVLILALVAIAFPTVLGGGCFNSEKTQEELNEKDAINVEKLKEKTLKDRSIKQALKSINDKENVTICGMKVDVIMKTEKDKRFSFNNLYQRIEKMKDNHCDLNSLINVYKFAFGCCEVDELKCIERITRASEDLDTRQQLNENEDLSIDKVAQLLETMNQPGLIKIGYSYANEVMRRAKEDGSAEFDCHYDSVYRKKECWDDRLKYGPQSVQNFLNARYDQMLSACKQKFPDILEDSHRLQSLKSKEPKSIKQIEEILRSFVHKKKIVVTSYRSEKHSTVQDILDQFGGTSWSENDCKADRIYRRKKWTNPSLLSIPDVRYFVVDRFEKLMSFCRENHDYLLQEASRAKKLARQREEERRKRKERKEEEKGRSH